MKTPRNEFLKLSSREQPLLRERQRNQNKMDPNGPLAAWFNQANAMHQHVPDQSVKVKLRNMSRRQEWHFIIRMSTEIWRFKRTYKERFEANFPDEPKLQTDLCHFYLPDVDGRLLKDDDTPRSLGLPGGLENPAIIQVLTLARFYFSLSAVERLKNAE